MEDNLIFFLKKDNLNFFENVRRPQQNNAIKIKNNGCGTAPGNLVVLYKEVSLVKIIWAIFGYLLLNL